MSRADEYRGKLHPLHDWDSYLLIESGLPGLRGNIELVQVVADEGDLKGAWLDLGTGVPGAHLKGIHLRLPGYGDNRPTLEIYQYACNESRSKTAANREGIMHLAFEVDNIEEVVLAFEENGGNKIGNVTSSEIEGVGLLTFVYLADPEGNIIELQSWS